MPRWLGVDHGAKRIGLAVGSDTDGVVSPLSVIPAEPAARAVQDILDAAGEYHVEGIVVGLPLNMDGTRGPQAEEAAKLAVQLAEAGAWDVRLFDERLSSFAADKDLAGRLTRKKKRARQDALAARHILREFFASDGPRTAATARAEKR